MSHRFTSSAATLAATFASTSRRFRPSSVAKDGEEPIALHCFTDSSISSSEGDYTDVEQESDYYLFQNVRKIPRRKRRKMPIEEYRKTKERKKLLDYVSDSSSGGEEEDYHYPSSAFTEVSFN